MEIHFKNARGKDGQEEITPEVTALAQRKLTALKKLVHNGDTVAQVFVELGKESEAHVNGKIWRAQINLDCKGKHFHANATAEKIESAIDRAVKELETELRKAKGRRLHFMRKGHAAIKSFMRGFGNKKVRGTKGNSFA